MIKKKSSFAGFLDGYKASNIASIEPKLQIYLDEILNRLESIRSELRISNSNIDIELQSALQRMTLIVRSNDDIISKSLALGEALDAYCHVLAEIDSNEVKENFKKIIFHYLKLAEKSEDKKLLSLAIKIGEEFASF